jgi:hypothetical protein
MTGTDGAVVDLPDVGQVAWVVDDLEAGMDRFVDLFGIGPWQVRQYEPPDLAGATYHGEPGEFGFRAALTRAGETSIELIEPTTGRSIYSEFLEERGPGMHHVAYFDWPPAATRSAVEALHEQGLETVQSFEVDDAEIWYLDTREVLYGIYFETGNLGSTGGDAFSRYPPRDHERE